MDKEKDFSIKNTLDYKTYKEFSVGYMAFKKSIIICMLILLALLILYMYNKRYDIMLGIGIAFVIFALIIKISGRNKLQYKRYKSLNNGEDLKTTIKINNEKIISTNQKKDTASYEFNQIIGIIETENLLILKLKYNMGIILNKNNIEGGTKDELINYLFSVCDNIKKKKVIKANKWFIIRKIYFAIIILMFVVSIVLLFLEANKMNKYKDLLEQNGYNVEMIERSYNGYNTKILAIDKDNENTRSYIYKFKNDSDAKRNLEYWANSETNNDIKDEYLVENSKDYKKYVIDNKYENVVLIRKDNYVFYGIEYEDNKEDLDRVLDVIEE